MKLPIRYNYAEAYLTLRCNLNCSYCINNESGDIKRARKEISGENWVNGLNKIDFGEVPLTLGGGEPTMHKDFYYIIDNLKPETRIDLLTNASFNMREFLTKTHPDQFNENPNPAYKSIRISFHAETMDPYETINRASILQEHGYPVGIFGLNHPLNLDSNVEMAEMCRKHGLYFFIKDFLGKYKNHLFGFYKYPEAVEGIPKKVLCRIQELLIGPTGDIYKCHNNLYNQKHSLGNIVDDFKITDRFRKCGCYGKCNPCDVKLKTNRFLKMGNCSVEIVK